MTNLLVAILATIVTFWLLSYVAPNIISVIVALAVFFVLAFGDGVSFRR